MNAFSPAQHAPTNRFGALEAPRVSRSRSFSVAKAVQLGNTLQKQGKLAEAETIFRQVLAAQPDNPIALLSLGLIAHRSGNTAAAIRLVSKSIEVAPQFHQAHNNLGGILTDLGQFAAAAAAYEKATLVNPDYAEAHYNLGVSRRRQNKLDEAIAAFERCRTLSPRRAELHFELGQCHQKLGHRLEAQIAFRVALTIDPDHLGARSYMGWMLAHMGHFDEAVAEFEHVLKIDSDNVGALNGLGDSFKRMGRFDESLDCLNRALALEPRCVDTFNNLASTHQSMGNVRQAAEYYGRVLELAPYAEFAEKSSLFVALNRPELSTDELFALHRRLRGRHDRPEVRGKAFAERNRDPDRKLRVGFIGSDFRTHVVALNIFPVMAHYDRDRFEIFLYSQEKSTDRMTQTFKELTDRYTAIDRYNDDEVAALIEKDEIDIAVYLAGRFDENRPLIAARRPAPIQVSFHDCATSGLEAMDYWLTDPILHPGDSPELFTEHLYRLSAYYQYPVQEGLPDVSPLPALASGHVTFGCFNKPEKINDHVISLWSEVLRAIPTAKLKLKYFNHYSEPTMRKSWVSRFADHGVSEDQLMLKAASENRGQHLLHYHDIDIALDPFPFNGATTTFEALSMGVPVIALQGRHFVDRVATSMVTHVGMPELAAPDRAGYVARAVELAGDLGRLAELRAGLRARLHASPLCDGPGYARSIGDAFRDMWRTWITTGGHRGK